MCVSFRTLELIELSCRMMLAITRPIEGTGTNHLPSNNVQSKGWACVFLAKGTPIIRHIRYLAVLFSQPAYKLRVIMIIMMIMIIIILIMILIIILIILIILILILLLLLLLLLIIIITWCNVMQYNMMQYNTMHNKTTQYNKTWYKIMPILSHKKGVGLQLTFSGTSWNLLQCAVIVLSEDL